MSYRLPSSDSPIRAMFDMATLVQIGTRETSAPEFRSAKRAAVEFLQSEPRARTVQSICLRANGDLVLIQVGRRGGHRQLWNFTR